MSEIPYQSELIALNELEAQYLKGEIPLETLIDHLKSELERLS